MKLISKLIYQARKNGLDIDRSDGVKLINTITKKYIHILPTGKICSDEILGHDRSLKELMPQKFSIQDSLLFSGSCICLPCEVSLYVGKDADQRDIIYAKHCIKHCFAYIKNVNIVKDDSLLHSECRVEHGFILSYKERQALINACLEYLI